jgi:DNA-binding ferritin-like protein
MLPHKECPVWHNPLGYDFQKDGPPYLPQVSQRKTASAEGNPLVELLGVLQAAALVHQSHHWNASGPSFYGDHLLFERLYTETLEGIDAIAERAARRVGRTVRIDPIEQTQIMLRCLAKLPVPGAGSPSELSLLIEGVVLDALKEAKAKLEDWLTDGTSNLLDGLADKHEGFVYLLQQRLMPVYDYR